MVIRLKIYTPNLTIRVGRHDEISSNIRVRRPGARSESDEGLAPEQRGLDIPVHLIVSSDVGSWGCGIPYNHHGAILLVRPKKGRPKKIALREKERRGF